MEEVGSMSTTEYHVVIACPDHWSKAQADLLGDRLSEKELPSTVGVFVWKLIDGKLDSVRTVSDGRFEDDSDE